MAGKAVYRPEQICIRPTPMSDFGGRIQWFSATPPSLTGSGGAHGDIADMVHGSAEGGAVGALEERVKCCSDLPGTGSKEQDWRSANCDAPWRHRAGVAPKSFGSAQA